MKKFIMLGYMGSGKSTVGKLLAKTINFPYKDLDEIIEMGANLSINKIFEQKGELFFRKLETQILAEIMQSQQSFVLSLGGGTPCYGKNLDLIKTHNATSIYLKVPLKLLAARLTKENQKRPLLKNLGEVTIEEFIAKHIFERGHYYSQATRIITGENKTPEEIVAEIMNYSK